MKSPRVAMLLLASGILGLAQNQNTWDGFVIEHTLRNELPTHFGDDSRPRLCPTLRQTRFKIRPLVRRSRLYVGATIAGREIRR